MGNVENAIAKALKQYGIDPPLPKLQTKSITDKVLDDASVTLHTMQNTNHIEHQRPTRTRKRKRRDHDKDVRKVRTKALYLHNS